MRRQMTLIFELFDFVIQDILLLQKKFLMNLSMVLKIEDFVKLVRWLAVYCEIYFHSLCFTFLALYFHYHLLLLNFLGDMIPENDSRIWLNILILIEQFTFIIIIFGSTFLRISLNWDALSLLYLLDRILEKWNLISTVNWCVRIQIVVGKVLYNRQHWWIYFEFAICILLSECVQVKWIESLLIFCYFWLFCWF